MKMRDEDVVPATMMLLAGVVLIIVGISFGFRAGGTPLWFYCPGLMAMGIPMLIGSLVLFKDKKNLEEG